MVEIIQHAMQNETTSVDQSYHTHTIKLNKHPDTILTFELQSNCANGKP
jgi:hypothetical protein